MDSFEWNKVFAGVIASALLVMVISTVSGGLFSDGHGEHGEGHAKPAYTIEVAAAETADVAVAEEVVPLAVLLANASAEKGERQFAKCKSCHTADAGKKDGTGPHLYGVLGRAVASAEGFKYSGDLQAVGGDWTWEKLDHWIDNPKSMAKGTAMAYAGLKKADQRADLLVYLNSMSDNPLPLPTADAAPAEAAAQEAEHEAAEHSGH